MAMHNFTPGRRPDWTTPSCWNPPAPYRPPVCVSWRFSLETEKRGPIGRGLPTLERHRGPASSACFADLALRFHMDGIFLGDPGISQVEQERIRRFCDTGALSIPAILEPEYQNLYGRTFTSRPDSPPPWSALPNPEPTPCTGGPVEPAQCLPRDRGVITMDNREYGRYSGKFN